MKTLQFFAYAFGSILLPLAILGGLALWGATQPTNGFRPDLARVAGDHFSDPAAAIGGGLRVSNDPASATLSGVPAAARGRWPDGTEVLLLGGGSAEAVDILDRAIVRLGSRSGMRGSSFQVIQYRTFSLPDGGHGRGIATDHTCAIITGPDESRVGEHARELAVFPHLEGNFVSRAMDEHTGETILILILIILSWAIAQMFIWPRLATRAVRRDPEPGVQPARESDLRSKLFALNELSLPFHLTPGKQPGRIMAEWRYLDATWAGLMRANGITRTARIELRLDPRDHSVRTIDHQSNLSWSAGGSGVDLSWSASRGITFARIDRGAVFGLHVEDGRPTSQPYAWRFDIREMKQPIIDIVTQSGWAWRPVMFFSRVLNG